MQIVEEFSTTHAPHGQWHFTWNEKCLLLVPGEGGIGLWEGRAREEGVVTGSDTIRGLNETLLQRGRRSDY